MSNRVPNQHVDFDLHIKDYNKLLVLVRNLLDPTILSSPPPPSSSTPAQSTSTTTSKAPRAYDCDCFDERECHHLQLAAAAQNSSTAGNASQHFTTRRMDKCLYCRFVDFLKDTQTTFKVDNDLFKSPGGEFKHSVHLNYKKGRYADDTLDWCEFQAWRAPYALVGFAYCNSKLDLLNALKVNKNYLLTFVISYS